MKYVLEVYHRRFQDNGVLVCLDETGKQLVRGNPHTPAGTVRGAIGLRLRILAQRGEQSVHALRAPGGLAAGGGDRAAHRDRLGGGQVAGVLNLVENGGPPKDQLPLP